MNHIDDSVDRQRRVDVQSVVGWLQVGELAVEQRRTGEMPLPATQPVAKQFGISREVHEAHARDAGRQDLAIPFLERRACHDEPRAVRLSLLDGCTYPLEPRCTIPVPEWKTLFNSPNVLC